MRVELPRERAEALTALIVQEQCCPFLDFSMTFDGGTVAVVITAPSGAETVIEDLVGTC